MNAQQLKNAILQEAIEGRLVPQDPNDEPASVLLARIRQEKERLVKEGKLKKKDLEVKPISEDEIPFEIPESWEWCRLGDIIEFINGRAYKKDELLDKGKYKVLRVGNFFTNDSWYYSDLELPDDKYCYHGDLLYAWSASFGPKIWEGEKTIFHYHIWNVKFPNTVLWREYLYYFFLADRLKIKQSTTGSTMIHVSMENMKPRLIPIPPLAEQHRIVEKLEELLPKVEEYGKAQDALNKLNAELPERLKKSILQEAIEGRLVPQDPNDEPASVLLDKIRQEKAQLVKAGKLKKKDLIETPITEDEIPFDIPESWEWVRIGSVFNHSSGKQLSSADTEGNLREYITTSNLYWDKFELDNLKSMYYKDSELERCTAKKGDLLVCEGGDIGRSAIWPYDYDICLQNHVHRLRPYDNRYTKYVYYVMRLYKSVGLIGGKGIGIQGLSASALKNIVIPLPPLAEQHRIVEKLEQLLGVINKLK